MNRLLKVAHLLLLTLVLAMAACKPHYYVALTWNPDPDVVATVGAGRCDATGVPRHLAFTGDVQLLRHGLCGQSRVKAIECGHVHGGVILGSRGESRIPATRGHKDRPYWRTNMAFGMPDSKKVKAAFERYEAAEAALVRTKDLEQALAEIAILKAFIEDLRQAF